MSSLPSLHKKRKPMPIPVKNFSQSGLKEQFKEIGFPSFRADQVLSWIYGKGSTSYGEMTNLPKTMREQLEVSYPLHAPKVAATQESRDGSRKYLIEFHDEAVVETVGLPSEDGRLTVCCSTQSGCAMNCSFCATGKLGLNRNLSVGEIVDQILVIQADYSQRVTNVVVMGQGEPFMNYEATLGALHILNAPKLLNIGARHITVSTCGVISGIERFSEEKEQFTLAVSLHSARQEVRDQLMPAMKNQRLSELRKSLVDYTGKTNRRFTFEYALMKGVNDSEEDLEALISYCRRLLCHVNLIPLNKVEDSIYRPVSSDIVNTWRDKLEESGIAATTRRSQGDDISAACGQLSSQYK